MQAITSLSLRHIYRCLALITAAGTAFRCSAIAQVVPDGTLGTESSQVDGTTDLMIHGGAQRQENLFHSFERFSLNEEQQAYFDNPIGVARIFSRITGSASSDIFGTLGVNGGADLFFLNPNGIMFGPNAQLDIAGSFAASTADSFMFADGNEFGTATLEAPMLTISTPLGIQVNGSSKGNLRSLAQLETGGDLKLYGHSLAIAGAVIAGGDLSLISDRKISANARFESGGDIQLLMPTGTSQNLISTRGSTILANGDVILGNYTGGALKIETTGNIVASSINTSNLTGGEGGLINLEAEGDINIAGAFDSPFGFPTALGSSSFSADGNSGDAGVINISSNAGGVFITGDIDSSSVSLSDNGPSKSGRGGNITVSANESIEITGGLFASSYSFSGSALSESNSGGNVTLSSGGNIDIAGNLFSSSTSIVRERGKGRAIDVSDTGDVNLAGGLLSFSDSSSFSDIDRGNRETERNTSQSGKGGTVNVSANGEVSIVGYLLSLSSSFSDSGSSKSEDGGAVTIVADEDVEVAGELSSSSFSLSALNVGKSGDGGTTSIASNNGDIRFIAESEDESEARILGAIVSSSFASAEAGSGGNVFLRAPAGAIVSRGTQTISAAISGAAGTTGAGGGFSLEAANSISGLRILTLSSGGKSGDVEIRGRNDLSIEDFRITTTGQVQIPNPLSIGDILTLNLDNLGQSGSTNINSQGDLSFENVVIQADANGAQTAGGVTLNSPSQITFSSSSISSNANSSGDAGAIRLDAERLILSNGVSLSASTSSSGLAGDISLNVADALEISDSTVTSSTGENSTGGGGNTLVLASTIALRNGSIEVNSQGTGQSGTVTIAGDQLILADRSRISAATLSSNGGDLTFNLEDLLLLRGDSEISTTAGAAGAGGNGGDVAIKTQFVVATPNENNDITANAFDGDGGNINVVADSGIFGIAPRLFNTPSSDITASSEKGVSGNVSIQSTSIGPIQSFIELPVVLVGTEVGRNCRETLAQSGSEFFISGRGGLPQGPLEPTVAALWADVLPIESDKAQENAEQSAETQMSTEQNVVVAVDYDRDEYETTMLLVEAQGFAKDESGETVLVAIAPQPMAANYPSSCAH